MNSVRVLFFVEPVIYRNNPTMLKPWIEFIEPIAKKSQGLFEAYLAASHQLTCLSKDVFCDVFSLDPKELLHSSEFDRPTYSRDLCLGNEKVLGNSALIIALEQIKSKIQPTHVISWSENQYLRYVFRDSKVLFMELGPLPRHGLKLAAFLDPFGHQIGCALQTASKKNWEVTNLSEVEDYWQVSWVQKVMAEAEKIGIPDWLQQAAPKKKRSLVVLQPPDWITYEGVGPRIDPIGFLQFVAREYSHEWVLIPQWHRAYPAPSDGVLEELNRRQPNICIPPNGLRTNNSEAFLPYVDGVATISSNVALAAALLGKSVKIIGRSKFVALDTGSSNHPRNRTDLLPFLFCKYCRPISDWINIEGAFARHMLTIAEKPDWLFDLSGRANLEEFGAFFVPN
jgi:hypothetical protein